VATNTLIPVALPIAADDYIDQWGTGTATLYLEYGTASPPTDGTATSLITSGTEHYEFWVPADANDYARWRVGNGTDYGEYSAVFQPQVAYCTLQEVIRGMDFPDESRYDELQDLCVEATDFITHKICGGRSFFREPLGSGTSVLSLDIRYPLNRLSLARDRQLDIVSLTTVEYAEQTGGSYTTLTSGSTGYYLVPDRTLPGWPSTDIVLSDQADTYTRFAPGWRTVRLTGVFGWARVPDLVRRATVDLARFWWNARSSEEPVGMSAFGQPVFGPGMPKSVRELYRSDYAWHDWVG
jgi:hypothetical protein